MFQSLAYTLTSYNLHSNKKLLPRKRQVMPETDTECDNGNVIADSRPIR